MYPHNLPPTTPSVPSPLSTRLFPIRPRRRQIQPFRLLVLSLIISMGSSKKVKKSKKDTRKHKRRHRSRTPDSESYSSSDEDGHRHHKKHKTEKKRKFRPPKRRRSTSSSASSSNYGDMNELLKTPPKHQKARRIMYRRKLRNIDPDMFLSLKKFAYDKEKMVENAFTTLRRGVIERICPPELEHLTVDELKERLIKLGSTMSKERLRSYADDKDLSHSSDSSEVETPTDDSESELEVVSDSELVEALFADKEQQAQAKENEIRERLTRKRLMAKMAAKAAAAKGLEEGEIEDDVEMEVNGVAEIPLPPAPPPPPPEPPIAPPTIAESSIRLEYATEASPDSASPDNGTLFVVSDIPAPPPPPPEGAIPVSPASEAPESPKRNGISVPVVDICTAPIDEDEELDYDDLGDDPDIDLF